MEFPHDPIVSRSEYASSSRTSEDLTERRRQMRLILSKMLFALGRELPSRDEMSLMVEAWLEIVTAVPTADLQASYVAAMRAHEGAAQLGANELFAAWRSLRRHEPPTLEVAVDLLFVAAFELRSAFVAETGRQPTRDELGERVARWAHENGYDPDEAASWYPPTDDEP